MALIEISLDSAESAIAAERGGAHRIELCSALREGGLTPSLGLVRVVRSVCDLEMLAIVRPRSGDFFYTDNEYRAMQEDVRLLKQENVDGVVFGILTTEGKVDKERTRALVELAAPMEVTFHRAFDMTPDLEQSLEDVMACGVHRVLTSGGAQSAWEGQTQLRALVQQAADRVTIVVGGGVRPSNVSELITSTGATEFHSSMRRVVPGPMLHQAKHLNLGEPGTDEFSRTLVSADEVKELMLASEPHEIKSHAHS